MLQKLLIVSDFWFGDWLPIYAYWLIEDGPKSIYTCTAYICYHNITSIKKHKGAANAACAIIIIFT